MTAPARTLEEMTLNHWQPLTTTLYDGWVLRFANGYTKRANSVSPMYASNLSMDQKIATCEDSYSRRDLPTIFKLTPFSEPAELDTELDRRGYYVVEPSMVQTLELSDLPPTSKETAATIGPLSEKWIQHFCELAQLEEKHLQTMYQMLSSIAADAGYLLLYRGDNVVGCGLGIVEGDYIGLYDIVIDSQLRNRGLGEQLLLHLLHWGREHGASRSYLAVVQANAPALRLYAKLGYTEAYHYWYRVKDKTHSN
ncbi:GNAT family N-acetyltransferase [Paenibacillus daejeonensis]|uniref:GNAT family N-acetyltransferase n=1 Tax=Paenibacillus daejeonensis TaxID=135193 RepID=UPI000364E0AA|nr:GNAT family N-acetyltransferase [Paenibacillus daejeonensis]